jgi:D-proline reductase (dithiol) PrdB
MFEAGGISTILAAMMPSWAEQYGVLRAVAVEFPFGHPLGLPDQPAMQTGVIKDALRLLEEATGPNTIVHLDHVWPEDETEWRRKWQPEAASPLIEKYLHQIRAIKT